MTALSDRTADYLHVPIAGITFAVDADPGVRSRLREISAPFYEPVDAPTGLVWRIQLKVSDPDPGTASDPGPAHGTVSDDDNEPPHRVLFDTVRRHIVIGCALPDWLPVFAVRHLCTVARSLAVDAGAVPLHGAAVELAGRGVMFVGEKQAGKTTSSLSLVRGSGGSLVSNDDVLLTDGPLGWHMVGGPRSVGVRTGSLAEHRPVLTEHGLLAAVRPHPANRPDKIFVFPGDVPVLGGSVRSEAGADVIIELVCRPGEPVGHEALDDEQAAAVLHRYLEPEADRRRLDLVRAIRGAPPALTGDTVSSLVRSLRFYRFSHPVQGWVDDLISFVDGTVLREGVGV